MSSQREFEALANECASLGGWLRYLENDAWALPTRCPPMDVHMLSAHLIGQLVKLAEVRDMPFIDTEPRQDRYSWWDYDREEDAEQTLSATKKFEESLPAGTLAREFNDAAAKAIEAVAFRLQKGNPVVGGGSVMVRLNDYVATRVLEMTIHGMDLRAALGEPPAPMQQALDVTGDILRELLGADLRPAITDERLCLIGTGRDAPTSEESTALGIHEKKLPLLT